MDEVDIDNAEDLNELEARLYAQIHHEATDKPNIENKMQISENNGQFIGTNRDPEHNYETSLNTNRILSRRYWAGRRDVDKQQQQAQTLPPKQNFIINPFKAPKNHEQLSNVQCSNKSQNNQQQSRQIETTPSKILKGYNTTNSTHADKESLPAEKQISNGSNKTETDSQNVALTPLSNNENKKNKNAKTDQHISQQILPAKKSNLKLNPVADWMKRKKSQGNKKINDTNKNSSINIKQGLFARQEQKLERAKRIEEKRQKSKKAKKSATSIANKIKPIEVINLDSDNESDSSDVVVIPTAPPPTFIVDDSGDEDGAGIRVDENNQALITMEHEENALDSTDVQMSSTAISFIKPYEIVSQSSAVADGGEKRLENSSRCTSPCSLQSSDDFIGQKDRTRLLAPASGTADDENMLVLTSDVNSLLEVPVRSKEADATICFGKEGIPLDSIQKNNTETMDSLEFAAPKTTKSQSRPKDYRVDQGQFIALDVYESESDITDSVYSKGANKSTVIRQIDTSSDEVEDISNCSQRTKRLRKRRASGSNKESDANNENLVTSSENENEDDDNDVLRTHVPFISKGIAVERYKPRKRIRSFSSNSPHLQKRKSTIKATAKTNYMSDTEFITTLNNLAQGQDGEQETQTVEEAETESETEQIPTAREIAEKILEQHNASEKNRYATDDLAIPENILDELEEVFETIDHLDSKDSNRLSITGDAVNISDSSDSDDREKHYIYKSTPNEEAQIIEYIPNISNTSKSPVKTHAEDGSPIYNIMYSRGVRKPGGIGWSDEMRKFYNDSWNGEHFILSRVLQKLNPNKSLWRIQTEDRFNIKKRNNIKCTNCCEFGHIRSRCKRPRKPMICYMCGLSGHYEPRCPNTICLRCGNKTQVFTKSCNACTYQNRLTCPICKLRGHSLDFCPDKWRRYHSTIEANVQPNSRIDYNPRRYCCICGGRGHISDNCRSAVRFLEYPLIASTIKSHQKSYSDVVVRTPFNGIALNLMYKPSEEYNFGLVDQTSLDKYYGRFLKAVGLDYLFQKKRHMESMSIEIGDSNAKRSKRLSKKYEASPYSKIGTANQKNVPSLENAPNQVQEISESGNIDQQKENMEDKSDSDIELTVEEVDVPNLQLNVINEKTHGPVRNDENFKSPKKVVPAKLQSDQALLLDSDSNYSFSEHFEVASSLGDAHNSAETPTVPEAPTLAEKLNKQVVAATARPKPREMGILPDFIPLIDSTEDQDENKDGDNEEPLAGISRRFVAVDSDDSETEETRRNLSPLPELPCEAKIYLTHFHTKYLFSPPGNAFLLKTSRAHKLKSRLDFTSVGHVLVIFGLPSNQNSFQKELLLKYRELEYERNEKQTQSNLNVPKRTYVLIRFLRENITQLMSNLGNVNVLLSRLQHHERQQTKNGSKLAEKARRSLNMILVGQAGLQDGTLHLDKLLMSLKTLVNDVSDDVAPPKLRSEITDHFKVIFSAYRHQNYQKLVETYNKLISKNRLPQLNIDPVLLGLKVLDTNLSAEQKKKLDQGKTLALTSETDINTKSPKQIVPTISSNQKNTKLLKRKQSVDTGNASVPCGNATTPTKKNKTKNNATPTMRAGAESSTSSLNIKTKSSCNNTPAKTKASTNPSSTVNKSKQFPISKNGTPTSNTNENFKKQQPKIVPPTPPFFHPEKSSTANTNTQQVVDKLQNIYSTLLSDVISENINSNKNSCDGKLNDSKQPSMFWSRKSMSYLDDCARLTASNAKFTEKLQRVKNKAKNGQLSYHEYLAVIKVCSALNKK